MPYLSVVGHEVLESETVVGDHKVDAVVRSSVVHLHAETPVNFLTSPRR